MYFLFLNYIDSVVFFADNEYFMDLWYYVTYCIYNSKPFQIFQKFFFLFAIFELLKREAFINSRNANINSRLSKGLWGEMWNVFIMTSLQKVLSYKILFLNRPIPWSVQCSQKYSVCGKKYQWKIRINLQNKKGHLYPKIS